MRKVNYPYILASKRNGTLDIGITNDIIRRVGEHKLKLIDRFTKKYNVSMLVYYEVFNDVNEVILREKRLKKWNKNWKIRLIEIINLRYAHLIKTFEVF